MTYEEEYEEFKKQYNMPEAEDIECLDLIMKREWAEKIVRGEKKIEFREMSDFYAHKLIDKNVFEWKQKMLAEADEELAEKINDFCDPLKPVYKIHFHNYNNSLILDVDVKMDMVLVLDEDGINFLHEEFDCHEVDAEYWQFEDDLEDGKVTEDERPIYFIFEIDKITNTNIEL